MQPLNQRFVNDLLRKEPEKRVIWAIKKKLITDNPARGIAKFAEEKRVKFLTIEQVQRFREALDNYADQSAANALKLLLLTGSRMSEVLKAEWKEFDLAHGFWTKPSHHTKQRKQESVSLGKDTVRLLESMAPENPSGPLFPGKERKGKITSHRVSLKRPWMQACKAAGLVEKYTVEGKRGPLTRYRPTMRVHDLRHNYASHLVSNGVSLQIVGKKLGHVNTSTTERYAHVAEGPLREAANQIEELFLQPRKPKAGKRRA